MAGVNLLVFRDNAETISRQELRTRLLGLLSNVERGDGRCVGDALLLAGQVECSLADCGRPSPSKAEQITDVLASRFVGAHSQQDIPLESLGWDVSVDLPEQLSVSTPEGFAHYGLHPGDFADAVADVETCGPVAVIGIRSVGTTLSAVAVAALRRKGLAASRITVRPVGHPYDRSTELDSAQKRWVREQDSARSTFLVIDEGPGLSGSSFLSTAESMIREGIAAERIMLIGTRDVDPDQLCAKDAGNRWRRLRWMRVPSRISQRFKEATQLSGGLWRELLLSGGEYPVCWPEMEAVKYLSGDRKYLFKFEGLGQGGENTRERGRALHKAGFSPRVEEVGDGMSSYQFVPGTPLARSDISTEVLERMAEYSAFRAGEFSSPAPLNGAIEDALRFNYSQELGEECPLAAGIFASAHPLICDSRMAPHEWIRRTDGRLLKVDGCKDGDNHFLPGPTDIAWDLAGAIVEWDMDADAREYFLQRFRARTGVSTGNVPAFVLGYSLFRASYCKMARAGTGVEPEKPRLQSAYRMYRTRLDSSVRAIQSSALI